MNSQEKAKKWVEFLAKRPEFAAGEALLAQFNNGNITELCNCGCNGFSFHLSNDAKVTPICSQSERGALAFEIDFYTDNSGQSVELLLFVDKNGNLDGIDVDCNGNSEPMPDEVRLIEPPYRIYGTLAKNA